MTRKRLTPSQPVSQPARATNPVIWFLHSTALMGDERWDEAITALRRFLELDKNPDNRQMAYQNLSACYLTLERFDEALGALLLKMADKHPKNERSPNIQGENCVNHCHT